MKAFTALVSWLGMERISGHSFQPTFVSGTPAVLDCGSHRGAFIKGFGNRFPNLKSAICVEANPALAQRLLEDTDQNVLVRHAAVVGDESQLTIELNISVNPEASSIFTEVSGSYGTATKETVPCVTLRRLLDLFENRSVDILKLDVEGAENEILLQAATEDLKKVTQLLVEFHDNFSPGMSADVLRVRRRLRSLGFFEVNANWPYTDDILFVNMASLARSGLRTRLKLKLLNTAYKCRGCAFWILKRIRVAVI